MMKVRKYEPWDYPIVVDWWERHCLMVLPERFLPMGFIADTDEMDVAAAWLEMSNATPSCWMTWFVANPEAKGPAIDEAFGAILGAMEIFSYNEGYRCIWGTYESDSLTKTCLRHGFISNHDKVSLMFKMLKLKKVTLTV